jgi:alpha-galactosidase
MIVASKLRTALDAEGFPTDWSSTTPIAFCNDWQGRNADPHRETEARILWSPDQLFLQFRARYRILYTFPNTNSRQDELWDRDVAEVFLQPPHQSGRNYAEFEISPNGDWLDLAIENGKLRHLHSNLKSRVTVHADQNSWNAELALPILVIDPHFDPHHAWRVNFFRIEGVEPDRFYSSWKPTNTDRPNFHVPEAFGALNFRD